MIRAAHTLPALAFVGVLLSPLAAVPFAPPAGAAPPRGPAPRAVLTHVPVVEPGTNKALSLNPMVWADATINWDRRTTPGCQIEIRILRKTKAAERRRTPGLGTWKPITAWENAKDAEDGRADGRAHAVVWANPMLGPWEYVAQHTFTCPPNPGSGHAPFRSGVQFGPVTYIITPKRKYGAGVNPYWCWAAQLSCPDMPLA